MFSTLETSLAISYEVNTMMTQQTHSYVFPLKKGKLMFLQNPLHGCI